MNDVQEFIIGNMLSQPETMNALYHLALNRAKDNYHHSAVHNSLLLALYLEAFADGMICGLKTSGRNDLLRQIVQKEEK